MVRSPGNAWRAPQRGRGCLGRYVACSSPQKLLACSHRVNDDRCRDTVDDTDLVDDGREVGPDDHRETFVEVEDPNRVGVRMQDVLVTDPVLARASAMIGSSPTCPSYLAVDPHRKVTCTDPRQPCTGTQTRAECGIGDVGAGPIAAEWRTRKQSVNPSTAGSAFPM